MFGNGVADFLGVHYTRIEILISNEKLQITQERLARELLLSRQNFKTLFGFDYVSLISVRASPLREFLMSPLTGKTNPFVEVDNVQSNAFRVVCLPLSETSAPAFLEFEAGLRNGEAMIDEVLQGSVEVLKANKESPSLIDLDKY